MSKDGQVSRAKKDLAGYLKVDEHSITVKAVKSTQWPNASLGKEEPGMGYAMVMIEGYVIDLEAGGKTYTYHADEDKRVVRAW
jgi:hypothetical protein